MKMNSTWSIKLISAGLLLSLTVLLPTTLASSGGIAPGVYSVTVTMADIPPGFPPEASEILVGTWNTELTEEGTTIVSKNGAVVATGRYTSNKSHFVMSDLEGPLACTDAKGIATGVYEWTLVGNELTLSTVLDRCFGRNFVLTLRPLQQL
jgi:hypothetical protein